MYQGKRVAVVSDIDDTLVDGVHYTANILGRNGEWTNKSFADFVMSDGCTALPARWSSSTTVWKTGLRSTM